MRLSGFPGQAVHNRKSYDYPRRNLQLLQMVLNARVHSSIGANNSLGRNQNRGHVSGDSDFSSGGNHRKWSAVQRTSKFNSSPHLSKARNRAVRGQTLLRRYLEGSCYGLYTASSFFVPGSSAHMSIALFLETRFLTDLSALRWSTLSLCLS